MTFISIWKLNETKKKGFDISAVCIILDWFARRKEKLRIDLRPYCSSCATFETLKQAYVLICRDFHQASGWLSKSIVLIENINVTTYLPEAVVVRRVCMRPPLLFLVEIFCIEFH